MEKTSATEAPTSSPSVETEAGETAKPGSARLGEMLGRAASEEREKQKNDELAKRARISNAD